MAKWRLGMAGGAVEFFTKMDTSEAFYIVYFTIIKGAELHENHIWRKTMMSRHNMKV